MTRYYRPLAMTDAHRPAGAHPLAGGWCWFDRVVVMQRDASPEVVAASDIPPDALDALTAPRPDIMGLSMLQPQIMGILNVTPDSFSDGGKYHDPTIAMTHALRMMTEGASIIDVGGESTRPGAKEVPAREEASRVAEAIGMIRHNSSAPISVDTRKAGVVVGVGALGHDAPWMINDVSAAQFDPRMAEIAALEDVPICLMHSVGTPETMQAHASYANVVLDVYDHLAERIAGVTSAGVKPQNIIVDPGIGFGKTMDHNLALLQNLSVFHSLGCPILLGASRKRFIGAINDEPHADARVAGSVAVAQMAVQQGVQILRVHDTKPTKQMLEMQMTVMTGQHDA